MNITLKDIWKSFGQNVVLAGVSLSLRDGEIVAIAGENGAGKSTLMKIIAGAEMMDRGQISIDDTVVHFRSPQDAMAYKISMIYQEMDLVPALTVAENMFLVDRDHKYGAFFSDRKAMAKDTRGFLDRMGLSIDPRVEVSSLNVAEQQLVEICKSLVKDTRLLIMDEPTAALNQEETNTLFDQIRRLRDAGMTVIYITHRIEEIFELADRVAILRDGQVTLEKPTSDVTQDELVRAMVGKQIENFYPKEHNSDPTSVVLEVTNLTNDEAGFHDVSFQVHKGEVLGLYGRMGSGPSGVIRQLFGDLPKGTGEARLSGADYDLPQNPRRAIHDGLGFLTADRKKEGLSMDMSISSNLSLVALKQFVGAFGTVKTRKERAMTSQYMQTVDVKAHDQAVEVRHLSGGNQQKVVFGKWMMAHPKLFIMEEPTRGVDVGAKTEIYRLINDLTRSGVSLLLVTSDIPEMVAMADRVLVFRDGTIVQSLSGNDITQRNLLDYSLRSDLND